MLTRHIRESLQVTPGPFPDFWAGPGDNEGPFTHLEPVNDRPTERGGGAAGDTSLGPPNLF